MAVLNSITIHHGASLLLFATLQVAVVSFSCASASTVAHAHGIHAARKLFYLAAEGMESKPPQTFFRTVRENRPNYGPAILNSPVHIDSRGSETLDNVHDSLYDSYRSDTSTGGDLHTDYAPAVSNPPMGYHDYLPGMDPAFGEAQDSTWDRPDYPPAGPSSH